MRTFSFRRRDAGPRWAAPASKWVFAEDLWRVAEKNSRYHIHWQRRQEGDFLGDCARNCVPVRRMPATRRYVTTVLANQRKAVP